MKYLYIVLIIQIFVISCTVNDSNNSRKANRKIEENSENIVKEKPNQIVKMKTDIKDKEQHNYEIKVLKLLKNSKLISESYPDSGLVNVKKLKVDDSKDLTFIQLNYDESLRETYESELVFNILILNDSAIIYKSKVIDSVYSEDFNFLFLYQNNYFFEFYSSPVGYTIYYIFNIEDQELYITDPLEEGFVIDTLSFNYLNKILTAKSENLSKEFELKKVW